MEKKKIVIAIICTVLLWIAVGVVDYGRVHSFEKPIFCVGTELAIINLIMVQAMDIRSRFSY